jgi:hypothetical protein
MIAGPPTCPSAEWVDLSCFGLGCYYFKASLYSPQPQYSQAESVCRNMGASVLSIDSEKVAHDDKCTKKRFHTLSNVAGTATYHRGLEGQTGSGVGPTLVDQRQ